MSATARLVSQAIAARSMLMIVTAPPVSTEAHARMASIVSGNDVKEAGFKYVLMK